jgi:hypothetical protein
MGYPITEPYWVRAKVGDKERWVLVQLFERRALTYTPDNPAAFQTEMGNVGLHYFEWRYNRVIEGKDRECDLDIGRAIRSAGRGALRHRDSAKHGHVRLGVAAGR